MGKTGRVVRWVSMVLLVAIALGALVSVAVMGGVSRWGQASPDAPSVSIFAAPFPFYGMHNVPVNEFSLVADLGINVVLMDFEHDGTPEQWLAQLDAAQSEGIKLVAWLWPDGWTWGGSALGWQIDSQAVEFVQTVAGHPALLAVYGLHEPYWNGCLGCGFTTAEQQALYSAIKGIRDVPVWSSVDSIAFWADWSDETIIADGVCDYCEVWYYPFRENGDYERELVVDQLTADLAVIRDRAPHSQLVWTLQAFAVGAPYYLRMPTAQEMRDLASIVYGMDVDGAMWYPWSFSTEYTDFLSNHPELHPVVGEIYWQYVLGSATYVYMPVVLRNSQSNSASVVIPRGELPDDTSPDLTVVPTLSAAGVATSTCTPTSVVIEDESQFFYGMHFVPVKDFATVKEMGVGVVVMDFEHDGSPEEWLSQLDAAQAEGIQLVAWLWPQGWIWSESENRWLIDAQAQEFLGTVARHPGLFAVYALHEPYWNGCADCGYTTSEQQALYGAIKDIADVPIWSGMDDIAYHTEQGEETVFADGVCDYCEVWYFPFKEGGDYERDELIAHLTDNVAVIRERAPNSELVWTMQAFATGAPYHLRMPDPDEMWDLAETVCSAGIEGMLWYPWVFDSEYSDVLSLHPETYAVVRSVYDEIILPARQGVASEVP